MIAADPGRELGPQCAARFGGRLPFLLKVLSADQALSIQVHPSRAQAEAGYLAENERGLAPDDPARNYVDDWPKPELLYALTPFEVVAGLRTPADAATLLRALAVDALEPLQRSRPHGPRQRPARRPSAAAATGPSALELARCRSGRSGRVVAAVVAACARLADSFEVSPYADACAAAVRVAAHHPGDLGLVALLLMRHEVLQPGQAVFMLAGGLHAYLRGTGIELLANSDNVVRAGLTGKHIDVPELLKLLDPAVSVPVLAPRVLSGGVTWFDTPAPEFRLYVLELGGPPRYPPWRRAPDLAVPRGRLRAAFGVRRGARASPGRSVLHLRRRRPSRSRRLRPPSPSRPPEPPALASRPALALAPAPRLARASGSPCARPARRLAPSPSRNSLAPFYAHPERPPPRLARRPGRLMPPRRGVFA